MTIEALATVGTGGASTATATPFGITEAAPASSLSFDSLVSTLESLNTRMKANEAATAALARGDVENLHQVLMRSEQTRLDFELLLAVRNKVLDAYQELMRMTV
jgi:flagellar hook-basal body complex protein FliE